MTPLSPLSFTKNKDGSFTVLERRTLKKQVIEDLPKFLTTYLNSRSFHSGELIELKKVVRTLTGPTPSSRVARALLGYSPRKDPIKIIDQKLKEVASDDELDAERRKKLFGESVFEVIRYKKNAPTEDTTSSEAVILKVFRKTLPKICRMDQPDDRKVANYVYQIIKENLHTLTLSVHMGDLPASEVFRDLYDLTRVKLLEKRFITETLDKELFAVSLGKDAKVFSDPSIHRRTYDVPSALPMEDPEVQKLINEYNSGAWKAGEEKVLTLDQFPEAYHDTVFDNLDKLFSSNELYKLFITLTNSFRLL